MNNDDVDYCCLLELHPNVGDLIEFKRNRFTLFSFWGIYVGDGEVIYVKGYLDDCIIKKFDIESCDRMLIGKIDNLTDEAKQRKLCPLDENDVVKNANQGVGKWLETIVG